MSAVNNCKGFTNLVETMNHNSKLNKPQVQEKNNMHIDYSSQNIYKLESITRGEAKHGNTWIPEVAEAGGHCRPGQPGLCSEALFKQTKQENTVVLVSSPRYLKKLGGGDNWNSSYDG